MNIKVAAFTASKKSINTKIFFQHGEIKDVRLVTYKSGQPKGLAYVEYVDEVSAL